MTGEYQRILRHRRKLLFLMFAGAIGIVFLVYGGYQLTAFMDSTAFCGQLCHQVMYPEYTAYQASPHSRVACAECHVGSGADYLVKSKLSGIPLVAVTLAGSYDRPIPTPVQNLRPARDTCEQCHRPEKFTGDIIRVHTTYLADEANTKQTDTRAMRVGGGEFSVARDIHWHIGAKVWYLPLDDSRQQIGWVGVEDGNGQLIEYVDPTRAAEVTPQRIQAEKRLMDCMDCHNRATHIFQSPEELIDTALTQGKIDGSLPFIKKQGVAALDPPSSSLDEALTKADAVASFYQANYPQVYQAQKAAIDRAVTELKNFARLTTFPDMKVNWQTYVDNIGHQQSPGCFRCHGKLVETTGPQQGQGIDAGCNSCHYSLTMP